MSTTVIKVKERLQIADVVGSYLTLEKAGINLKAKCPFHKEKTASFFVSPARGTFYCFGCGAKGDIFSFVEKFEGVDFMGALRVLASRAGVPIELENTKTKDLRERMLQTLESATVFFEKELAHNSAVYEYALSRGLLPESISSWRLGYAPPAWRSLRAELNSQGFSDSELFSVGLVKKPDTASKTPYDTFRGRLMFPIFDSASRIVGFSGRIFKDDGKSAKYLNSPETELFLKSKILYGLHKAKLPIHERGYVILVEGQVDLLMAHQAGFTNAVASSGTALTESHLEVLRRFTENLIMAFDADLAGERASEKGFSLALSEGFQVKIASLPPSTDPAELILKNPHLFAEAIKSARHVVDFALDRVLEKNYNTPSLRAGAIEGRVFPLVRSLKSAILQSEFIHRIAECSKIREEALWTEFMKNLPVKDRQENFLPRAESGASIPSEAIQRSDESVSRRIFSLLFRLSSLGDTARENEFRQKVSAIIGEDRFKKFYEKFLPLKDTLIFETETLYPESTSVLKEIPELLLNFEEEHIKTSLSQTLEKLASAERRGDTLEATQILTLFNTLSKELREISAKRDKL